MKRFMHMTSGRLAVVVHAGLGLLIISGVAHADPTSWGVEQSGPRFRPVDIFVTSARPLAAYQLELVVEAGEATLVGVEGGEHGAYRQPPYFDPMALMGDRIVLAAFSTASELPTGRTRVATVHVREAGAEPRYTVRLQAVADPQGKKLAAEVELVPRQPARARTPQSENQEEE